ncbi:unnamed protein product [Adineta steineri]|uniref:Uncharacterized protein n=1 Tax=Adineta steineri TaxID=433720 RepID=A0A819XN83_9BILA|nr:unnamed protein product [Adineta steineri]CAF4143317.1 unnamed protein product [Adineta steineri]
MSDSMVESKSTNPHSYYKKNEERQWKMREYDNEEIVVANRNGERDQLNSPTFIFVDKDQSLYITDCNNHRVIKWRKDAKERIIVAESVEKARFLNQLSEPNGVIVNHLDQIYMTDCWNNRIMRLCEEKEESEIVIGENGKENQLNDPLGLSFNNERNL